MRINNSSQDGMDARAKLSVNKEPNDSNVRIHRGKASVNLSKAETNPIATRRQLAHKQAMKLIKDAFKGQQNTVDQMNKLVEFSDELRDDCNKYRENIKVSRDGIDELRENYGLSADSDEQKEADLFVRKYVKYETLSDEEEAQLEKIQNRGFTDYQKKYISESETIKYFESEIAQNSANIQAISQSISSVKQAMLKDQSILKAENAAEEIEKEAIKDELAAIIVEGKEHIDEELDEIKEKIEKVKEKRLEEEEKELKAEEREARIQEMIERIKENAEDSEVQTDEQRTKSSASVDVVLALQDILSVPNLAEAGTEKDKMNSEIKNIAAKLNLVDEDIKGVDIDKLV